MPEPYRRWLGVKVIDEVTEVTFPGLEILDDINVEAVSAELYSLVDDQGCRNVRLNLAGIDYISSAALAAFITLHNKLKAVGGRIQIVNIEPSVNEVFTITRLKPLFGIPE